MSPTVKVKSKLSLLTGKKLKKTYKLRTFLKPAIAVSKLTTETLEQSVKYVQS